VVNEVLSNLIIVDGIGKGTKHKKISQKTFLLLWRRGTTENKTKMSVSVVPITYIDQ
jgi:hypothetical protein